MLLDHKDVVLQLERMQNKLAEHDNNILLIFEYIKQLEQEKQYNIEQQDREKIGYKRHDDLLKGIYDPKVNWPVSKSINLWRSSSKWFDNCYPASTKKLDFISGFYYIRSLASNQ